MGYGCGRVYVDARYCPYSLALAAHSAVTALQSAVQLEVARLIFCVLRDEHLSIDRFDRSINMSVHSFASPAAAAGFVGDIAAILLAATP